MNNQSTNNQSTERDPRVRAIAAIWGCAIGMFGICIPLSAITNSGVLLPLLVMLGAGGGTAVVWLAPEKRRPGEIHLVETVQALEERVKNLETIYTSLPEVAQPLSLTGTRDG